METVISRPHTLRPLQTGRDIHLKIPAGEIVLKGDLHIPEAVRSLVIFAHASGSGRYSATNRYLASVLHERSIGTLLLDLLTENEDTVDVRTRRLRFDVGLLCRRLLYAYEWAMANPALKGLKIGYFGANTGSAAAVSAAARHPRNVAAIVLRGGRPDMAGDDVLRVRAPTLLLVGARDPEVLAVNKKTLERLNPESKLDIIPRATHLFEEAGTLEEVAALSARWFDKFLSPL